MYGALLMLKKISVCISIRLKVKKIVCAFQLSSLTWELWAPWLEKILCAIIAGLVMELWGGFRQKQSPTNASQCKWLFFLERNSVSNYIVITVWLLLKQDQVTCVENTLISHWQWQLYMKQKQTPGKWVWMHRGCFVRQKLSFCLQLESLKCWTIWGEAFWMWCHIFAWKTVI